MNINERYLYIYLDNNVPCEGSISWRDALCWDHGWCVWSVEDEVYD